MSEVQISPSPDQLEVPNPTKKIKKPIGQRAKEMVRRIWSKTRNQPPNPSTALQDLANAPKEQQYSEILPQPPSREQVTQKTREFSELDAALLPVYDQTLAKLQQSDDDLPFDSEVNPEVDRLLLFTLEAIRSSQFKAGFRMLNSFVILSKNNPFARAKLEGFLNANIEVLNSYIQVVDRSKIKPLSRKPSHEKSADQLESELTRQIEARSLDTLKLVNSLVRIFHDESEYSDPNLKTLGLQLLESNLDAIGEGYENSTYNGHNYLNLLQTVLDFGGEDKSLEAKQAIFKKLDPKKNPHEDFGLAEVLLQNTYKKFPFPENTKLVIAQIFNKYGLRYQDLIIPWTRAVWDPENPESSGMLGIHNNLLALKTLEINYPGVAKWLVEKLGVKDFSLNSPNYLHGKFHQFEQTGIVLKGERELIQSLGLNFDEIFPIWADSHPDFFKVMDSNISAMKYLESQAPGMGICKYLYEEYGIANFARYPAWLLLKQFDEREITGKPFGVVLYPYEDDNGGFYSDSNIFDSLGTQIQNTHSLKIIEASSKTQAAELLCAVRRKHGKAEFGILGGHGSENSIQLGAITESDETTSNEESEPVENLFTDPNVIFSEDISKKFPKANARTVSIQTLFRYIFVPNPTIILISCFAGVPSGMAEKMSALGAYFIGPDSSTSPKTITAVPGENNKLNISVEYYEGKTNRYFKSQKIS